jgi:hypothetical protein
MPVCSCCGIALTDPISIHYGMGAVCRAKQKTKEANQGNLFAMRSSYTVSSYANTITILDRVGMKSVTNDIENVLRDIHATYGNLDNYKIMYRDSAGVFDGIRTKNSHFDCFFSINETDENRALEKLQNGN